MKDYLKPNLEKAFKRHQTEHQGLVVNSVKLMEMILQEVTDWVGVHERAYHDERMYDEALALRDLRHNLVEPPEEDRA